MPVTDAAVGEAHAQPLPGVRVHRFPFGAQRVEPAGFERIERGDQRGCRALQRSHFARRR